MTPARSPLLASALSALMCSALTRSALTLSALTACDEARRTLTPASVSLVGGGAGGSAGAGAGGGLGGGGGAEAGAEPPVAPLPPPARAPRRLTVEQLTRAIPVLTGGVRWVEDFGQGPVDMLTFLAPTLGAPDYRGVTEELLEPTLLISKFVQDGAQRVCEAWVARDAAAPAAERSLVRHDDAARAWGDLDPVAVRANISRLLLRFFAYEARLELPGGDPRVEALYALFDAVAQTAPAEAAPAGGAGARGPARDAWLATCLALMTDPELLMY